LGLVEGLKVYPVIMERVRQAADAIMDSGADAAILIDSWGFMIRVAKALKKRGYTGKIIKYVAPQVWAMREGRSKILAQYVDHLLSIHSFDAPYFTKHGLNVDYVGNPEFDEDFRAGDGAALRQEYNVDAGAPVLVLLFGSRLSEIERLATPFAVTVERLKNEMSELTIFSPVSDTIAEDVLAAASVDKRLQDVIFLGEDRKLDCFAAATAALACSGTVTTQLASAGIPTVVGYRLSAITHFIGKRIFKPDYASIVNISAGQELMPEFIQRDCTGANMAGALMPYLAIADIRAQASGALSAQIQKMRMGNKAGDSGSSSERAARAVLSVIA
jgi:lipid-A-disaccharide synthase